MGLYIQHLKQFAYVQCTFELQTAASKSLSIDVILNNVRIYIVRL